MNSSLPETTARTLHHNRRDLASTCKRESVVNNLDIDHTLAAVHTLRPCEAAPVDSHAVGQEDLQKALALPPYWKDAHASVYILPDAPWGHRASSCLNSLLARLQPDRANAVLRLKGSSQFEDKIQSRVQANDGARRWMIDPLPVAELDNFIQAFSACRWGDLRSPVFRAWQ